MASSSCPITTPCCTCSSGRFDDDRGWGQSGETWTVMEALAEYGEEDWFRLGDRDFATHIARTARIREGRTLTEAVLSLQTASASRPAILPMADAPVRTEVRIDEGWIDFQEYFVHRRQGPEVREVRSSGENRPTEAVVEAIGAADVLVIGPSNPIVSIGPILAGPIGISSRNGRSPASRSWRSARSSVAWRSRGRPTGCSCRSATNRAPGEWPGSTAVSPPPSCSTRSTLRSSPRSLTSASGPSSSTRSWATTPAVPGCARRPGVRGASAPEHAR